MLAYLYIVKYLKIITNQQNKKVEYNNQFLLYSSIFYHKFSHILHDSCKIYQEVLFLRLKMNIKFIESNKMTH